MVKEKIKKILKKEKKFIGFILIVLILCGILYLGYYGGQKDKSITIKCEFGVGGVDDYEKMLCWKWRMATDCEMLVELGINPAAVGVSC